MVTVNISLPGASPTQLETEVTRKVEDAVATINGVKRVTSNVSEGLSGTFIEFQLETDLPTALDDVRDAVTRIRADLPQDIQEPVVAKVEIGGSLMTYTVGSAKRSTAELSWLVDREISKALYGVAGVARVGRQGGLDREIRVDLDPQALQAWGLTAGAVSQQLARSQAERPGGKAENGRLAADHPHRRHARRRAGPARFFPVAARWPLDAPVGGGRRSPTARADPSQVALLDGVPVVAFSISRTRGSSEVEVAKGVRATLEQLKRTNPDLSFQLVTSTVEEAERSYDSSMTMLYEGAALALFVVWLFLRDWRATWISAVALPLSVIPTFAVMYFFGFTLNIITLLALSVVVGILVDDAIVEIENIVRHLRMGKSPMQARSTPPTRSAPR
jgi:multidrug efflux pump subunit AcrB